VLLQPHSDIDDYRRGSGRALGDLVQHLKEQRNASKKGNAGGVGEARPAKADRGDRGADPSGATLAGAGGSPDLQGRLRGRSHPRRALAEQGYAPLGRPGDQIAGEAEAGRLRQPGDIPGGDGQLEPQGGPAPPLQRPLAVGPGRLLIHLTIRRLLARARCAMVSR
jgi:hypothetical protein